VIATPFRALASTSDISLRAIRSATLSPSGDRAILVNLTGILLEIVGVSFIPLIVIVAVLVEDKALESSLTW
jgi:hypothetical protein